MNEKEIQKINLCLNIISIDKMLKGTIKMLEKEHIEDIDLFAFNTILKSIEDKVNLIKKYNIGYETVKEIVNKNKNEFDKEQEKAINELINEYGK